MKTSLIILFLFPLFVFGQTIKTVTLKFSMADSRESKGSTIVYFDTIQFFKGNQLANQIIPKEHYYKWPVEIKDFKSGTYTVFYRDLYKKKVSRLITVPETKHEYKLRLCWDELLDYPLNSLSSLKSGETIKILYSSSGCFHFEMDTLLITRHNGSYIAKLTNGAKPKSVTLNHSSIDAFRRFENEIQAVKDSRGCTTKDTYDIQSKSWTLKRMDGGCSWDGFYYLKMALFGKTE